MSRMNDVTTAKKTCISKCQRTCPASRSPSDQHLNTHPVNKTKKFYRPEQLWINKKSRLSSKTIFSGSTQASPLWGAGGPWEGWGLAIPGGKPPPNTTKGTLEK